ncbi:hypothetical protein [Calothrix sp. PCC 6303]|uniref:hypothetical protein n=1 Tax=Calothrix sp. PCC 6303 TaxID=1170562 RepID=UPI0002A055BD|nr:hypothetical protein [Calothrix sp. PCC 6303]AFZ03121.1 hypothetical protein Cal6303_4210 [Calothrix sp. PCC 6303]
MLLNTLCCHSSVVLLSAIACVSGLVLLWGYDSQNDEAKETERILFMMSFSYWLVYCVAFGMQKITLPGWETLIPPLKITTALAYLLTFSCILSLPLHKFAVNKIEE